MGIKEINQMMKELEIGNRKRKKLDYRRLYWTKREDNLVRKKYLLLPVHVLARQLGRTEHSVYKRGNLLGIAQKKVVKK